MECILSVFSETMSISIMLSQSLTLSLLTVFCVLSGSTEDATANKENTPSNRLGDDVFCFCRRGEYGRMIACDNPHCKYEWFHFDCVNLTVASKGKWYCSSCKN